MSADDVAMSIDADMTEAEAAETLDYERWNEYIVFRLMVGGV